MHVITKSLALGVVILTALATLAVPAFAENGGYPVTVTDTLGNELTVEEKPSRVVIAGKASLLTANAFYLFEDARDSVAAIGRTNQGLGNFLPYIDDRYESLTRLPHQVGPEQILAQRPDLVILKDFVYGRLGKQLDRLGIPVLPLSLESPESFRRDIRLLGKVLDEEKRAEEIIGFYDERLRAVTDRTGGLAPAEKPRTLLLYYNARGGEISFNIAPRKWIQTFQVEAAGGRPVWTGAHAGNGWMTVNFEQIAAWDPDHIFITSFHTAPGNYIESIRKNPQWQALRAVKNGNLAAVPADFYSWAQPDTRWILAVQWMAERLHPELFPGLDMRREAGEFYSVLYDLEERVYEEVVAPRLEEELSD